MGLERLVDLDLADRRADRAEADAARPEQVAKLRMMGVAEVEDVDPVDRSELDVADPVLGKDVDLFHRIARDFVGKGAEADHRRFPWQGYRVDRGRARDRFDIL